ncbi:hypothetical protein AVDCRST_MAG92-3820 [uncultured Coleofasciculus sp.]|uniref:Uncharacterized protein n=1 Tax=uncultured Coleofasciculus sp. TaxID=1267456 RepID=A0A6J4JRS5_9CYAN|nr:hypothetical protein AVDCRST_MAG92-3820 [uncultured Coleofasciculus sp.]
MPSKLIAPLTYEGEGSCNRSVFEQWLSDKPIPELKSGQIVILDNGNASENRKN